MKSKRTKKAAARGDVGDLINKGLRAPSAAMSTAKNGTTGVVLRIPTEMLSRIDKVVNAREIRIPRHTWILEAILEKLSREKSR